ncbi:hypothetical protein FisN_5Lh357 [Fistulifera solaris]|uniref:Uncharacterized protein n=1 Tax=Fistulifera solaris TaxID=1519565 RepID=A0A1Z5KG54_FISSO|nr:hypothetical protein FisN_5Lh357 [Fistulifera solaris]|eukprot:GAX25273.1 hypothetical protein FisN_5Lh357 [Fistulifera solaris]
MSESLRRSSRRSKKRTYSVGNLVEIFSKDDGDTVVAKGRLIANISDDPAADHQWLVEIDGGLPPKEEMHESRLGEILGKVDASVAALAIQPPSRSLKSSTSSVTSSKEVKNKLSPKETTDSTQISETGNARASSSIGKGKASKGKKVELQDPLSSSEGSLSPLDQDASPELPANNNRNERRLHHPLKDIPRPLKKQKIAKQKEEVVRIPMKTGILLLYRGVNRRAEFVRKA